MNKYRYTFKTLSHWGHCINLRSRYCAVETLKDTEPNYQSFISCGLLWRGKTQTTSWVEHCSFTDHFTVCFNLLCGWYKEAFTTGSLLGNVQRQAPSWFMCYITLITPLSCGWYRLDSILVPGCPAPAAPVLTEWLSRRKSNSRSYDYYHEPHKVGWHT